MKGLGAKLSALREERHWSKTYVAKQLKMNLPTYANYEYGNREPDLETTTKLAKLFNVSTDYLLGRNPKEDDLKTAALADDATIFTYKGQPLSDDDKEIIRRLMNGK